MQRCRTCYCITTNTLCSGIYLLQPHKFYYSCIRFGTAACAVAQLHVCSRKYSSCSRNDRDFGAGMTVRSTGISELTTRAQLRQHEKTKHPHVAKFERLKAKSRADLDTNWRARDSDNSADNSGK